jgi:hypothetical protein
MKDSGLTFVLTADQQNSRRSADRVPEALSALAAIGAAVVDPDAVHQPTPRDGAGLVTVRPFERTAGDEIQAVLTDGSAVVTVVQALVRMGGWRMGIGLGEVDEPLPSTTRAGRGDAFLAARDAVEAARRSPVDLSVRRLGSGETAPGAAADDTRDAEAALWLLVSVLRRRSPMGWEVVDLLDGGATRREAAGILNVSASAVSQRLAAAAYEEAARGADLTARLLDRAAGRVPTVVTPPG